MTKTTVTDFNQRVIETLQRGESLPLEWARELFPPEKREYELVYQNKMREEDVLADTMAIPMQPVSTFGKVNGWENKLIFGDNLQSMKTLLLMKERGALLNEDGTPGVRLVYIDPPFATKRDFQGSQGEKAFADRVAGTQFLEFLRRRLILIRELLAADGSVYVHLDWKRQAHVRVLMDEIFGESNFRNEIHWYYYNKMGDARKGVFPRATDTLLFYVKNASQRYPFTPLYEKRVVPVRQLVRKKVNGRMVNVKDDAGDLVYQERDVRTIDNVWRIPLIPPADRQENTGFPTQKPEQLLSRVIEASSKPGDLVLDAFAGSGTTLAVAEKLGRRWLGIDSGKLSIYTVQKRMLNLKTEFGNKGKHLKPHTFSVYNAGLYEFSTLTKLPWRDWRFFALQLFGCIDEPHTIGGLKLDGKLRGASVLVFDHISHPGQRIDEDTISDIHTAVGNRIGSKFFIVAPRGVFDFQQDFIDMGSVRYYALRIPYSFIHELHNREFMALTQPANSGDVNAMVDSVGFDFIEPPVVKWSIIPSVKTKLTHRASLHVESFKSGALAKSAKDVQGLDAFSMLMLDFDYNGSVFEMDEAFYAQELKDNDWSAAFDPDRLGSSMMAVFLDIYGNEAREVISTSSLPAKLRPAHLDTLTGASAKAAQSKKRVVK